MTIEITRAIPQEERTETFELTMMHTDEGGNVLNTLVLTYPTLSNLLANKMQLDILKAITEVAEGWALRKEAISRQ